MSTLALTLRVTERELRTYAKLWKGSVFTNFVGPVLLLLALGVGLGGLIEDRPSLDGLDYLDFVAPGLAVAASAQLGAGMSLWPIMAGHRWLGFHRAMVASPVGPNEIALGYLLWVVVRAVAQSAVFVAIAAALGAVDRWTGIALPLISGLTAAAFASPLMAYTERSDSDGAFDPIMRIVVTPLYFFSGSVFPTSQLPDALEAFIALFPLWHGIELGRWVTTGTAGTLAPPINLAVLAAWVVAGHLFARRTFPRRLTP